MLFRNLFFLKETLSSMFHRYLSFFVLGGSVVSKAEIINLTDDVTIYQSSSRKQASPRGSLTPTRGYSPSRGSTPRGSSTPRGESNREMTLYRTPHGIPLSARGTPPSGRGTPRVTPHSSHIVSGYQNRSLADSARRRNLFQVNCCISYFLSIFFSLFII